MSKAYKVTIDGLAIQIPLTDATWSHFTEQFPDNTEPQQKRRRTLRNIVVEAYKKGRQDGVNGKTSASKP